MTTDTAINTALPIAVFVIMFALGLGLTADDFRRALRAPKALVIGVICQVVLVPIVGVSLVALQHQDASLALGIVILTLCPGGAMSNLLTRLAGGDVALSVSLTAATNLLAVLTLPILSLVAADHFLGADADPFALSQVMLRVATIATLPVVLGMLLRHLTPFVVGRYETAVFRAAFAVFVLILAWSIAAGIEALQSGMILLGRQLTTLTLFLLGLGLVVGTLFRLEHPQRVTVVVETGVQNSGLGLVVGSMLWTDPTTFPLFATPSAVYGALTYLLTFPLIFIFTRAWRRL